MLDSMTPIIGISYAACKLLRATDEAELHATIIPLTFLLIKNLTILCVLFIIVSAVLIHKAKMQCPPTYKNFSLGNFFDGAQHS